MVRPTSVPISAAAGSAGPATAVLASGEPPVAVPRRPVPAGGLQMLGEFTGSGLRNRAFLVRRCDGQVITLTDLLVNIVDAADGSRDIPAIADRVSAVSGRMVSADNVEYLLTTKLIPLGVIAGGRGATATPRVTPLLGLAGRRTLIPAPAVGVLARVLAPLFRPTVVTGILTAVVMLDVWLLTSSSVTAQIHHVLASPALILAVLGGTFVSMIFHECGHAAACHYGGGRPGVIGCGMYLLWPAFYTDVTDAYRLDRTARLRTDLGGVYFNAIFIVGLGIAFAVGRADALVVIVLLVHLEAFQQLVPVLRLDGYYILSDLAGVPDLFARIGPVLSAWLDRGRERCQRWTSIGGRHRRRNRGRNRNRIPDPRVTALTHRAQRTITAWVLVMAPLLATNLVLIIMIAPSVVTRAVTSVRAQAALAARSAGAGEPAAMIAEAADAAVLALPAVGIAFLLLRLASAGVRAAVVAGRGGPGRAAAALLGVIIVVGVVLASWLR
ncbi:hypothetical protein [Protofrankia symbiont of Coriaria ruscifolia]|uniref:hypothetical protein n=1 Tax=Protofrankia symbiont of Coriaria ruscifolia TaxID=1306542 RepID=UPI001040ED2E|nr:hypothetical protein [Protofrankia symbiont of Coriaria ruscifolia]